MELRHLERRWNEHGEDVAKHGQLNASSRSFSCAPKVLLALTLLSNTPADLSRIARDLARTFIYSYRLFFLFEEVEQSTLLRYKTATLYLETEFWNVCCILSRSLS
jgi:predicted transporter